jgi:hypothetical protein
MQNIIGVFRMRQNVKSRGQFYGAMAAEVEPHVESGGAAAARAARFLSEAVTLAFERKLMKQQHAVFEIATAMTEVETAVALTRVAAARREPLIQAQARVWASDVDVAVAVRLLKLFSASDVLDGHSFTKLSEAADVAGAIAWQAGRLADMDFIAQQITA